MAVVQRVFLGGPLNGSSLQLEETLHVFRAVTTPTLEYPSLPVTQADYPKEASSFFFAEYFLKDLHVHGQHVKVFVHDSIPESAIAAFFMLAAEEFEDIKVMLSALKHIAFSKKYGVSVKHFLHLKED